jgi:hypothetical protein
LRKRLYACSLAILILGLCSGAAIHVLAEDRTDDGDGYVIVDGKAYPAGVYQSKRYQRELERYGGKANVLFDEFNRWFASLWQGKTLGATLACIGVALSFGLFLLARYLYPEPPAVSSDFPRKNPTEETDL